MRNDTAKWPEPTVGQKPIVAGDGITLNHLNELKQTIISGPRATALAQAKLDHAHAWPDVVLSEAYAISLRHDRLLLIGDESNTYGWGDESGLAISDASCAFDVIEVRGERALEMLRTGTELSLKNPSASAARLWNGYEVVLYAHGARDNFRMHVQSAYLEAAWDMCTRQMRLIST